MYTKKRAEFGHHCTFTDIEAKVLESVPSTCVPAAAVSRGCNRLCPAAGGPTRARAQGRVRG